MSYDEKCFELALAVLDEKHTQHINTYKNIEDLAQEIQEVVETFINNKLDNYEPPDDPVAWSGGFADNH